MSRVPVLALVLLASLSACKGRNDNAEAAAEAVATEVPKAVAANAAAPVVENQYATPVKDRVATIGLLNKRNNLSQDIVLKTGEARRVGNVVVKLATCERSLPWERPPETGAFVQVFVEERNQPDQPLAWHKVFSGWLFKDSPSLNVVEHPVYDVWVKDCAMKFPGEEDAAEASASSAANPAGSASPALSPTASPRPSPFPRPSPRSSSAAAPNPGR